MKINKQVTNLYQMVRVIGIDQFTEPCTAQTALDYAIQNDLDLVLVNDKTDIPICKIYDVKKESFKKSKKSQTSKTKLKTIQLGLDITDNDVEYRVKNAIKFLDKKNQVKVSLLIKGGRNMKRGSEVGGDIINSFVTKINEENNSWNAEFTSQPRLGGNTWTAIIIAKKK